MPWESSLPIPDYVLYHRSIAAEFAAVKGRLNQLIGNRENLGEYREVILRSVLRRHLPANLHVGSGFIVTQHAISPQLDLLIIDRSKPVLFQDGDFLVVTPENVRAVVEVKTVPGTATDLRNALVNLGEVGKHCWEDAENKPWLGLYVYNAALNDSKVLDILVEAAKRVGHAVNCVTLGENRFYRFWESGKYDRGEAPIGAPMHRFRSYDFDHLSPSYFISNLIHSVAALERNTDRYAWFPLPEGKDECRQIERPFDFDNEQSVLFE